VTFVGLAERMNYCCTLQCMYEYRPVTAAVLVFDCCYAAVLYHGVC